jgi:hypothetical protein
MHKLITGAAVAGLMVLGGAGAAFAGEVTGSGRGGPNGDGTPGATTVRGDSIRANSICAFSGLADGGEGEPAGPGAPPQNWGHVRQFLTGELGLTPAQIKASGEQPGDSCNGHRGFLAGGGEE